MKERVGNAQRTQVLDLLSRALEEGYIELAEYEHRMTVTTSAKTADELIAQVADLPPQFQWDPRRPPPPANGAPARPSDSNAHGTAIASMVLAIISLPFSVCYGVGALFGIAAVVLSRPGMRTRNGYGMALTGLVIGLLGICASVAMFVLLVFVPTSDS